VRTGRILAICLLATGLAPGTWVRTPIAPAGPVTGVTVTPLASRAGLSGAIEVTGAWEIESPHPFFGGFSAMVGLDDAALLIGSDRGWMMRLPLPPPLAQGGPRSADLEMIDYPRSLGLERRLFDLESMARDPQTGTLWTAYEGANAIVRDAGASVPQRPDTVRRDPIQMQDWSINSGPETMVRLPDGRFIMIAEGKDDVPGKTRPGLLFATDPVADTKPIAFRFSGPDDYSPVDATALPDGRVLILLRRVRYAVPVRFDALLMIADPNAIREGKVWTGSEITRFAAPDYGENFEGVAFVAHPDTDGEAGSVYVIADDNLSVFQRTLLLRLAWPSG